MSSIKVAVRVRPFNKREKEMNSKLIISMDNNNLTTITDPVRTQINLGTDLTLMIRTQAKLIRSRSTTVTGLMMALNRKSILDST
jgi:hypothetical protein